LRDAGPAVWLPEYEMFALTPYDSVRRALQDCEYFPSHKWAIGGFSEALAAEVAPLGLGAGWYEKDYAVYGYHHGTVKSGLDLFDAGLSRIEHRLSQLTHAPRHKIPILIGGGERRTLPTVARHADIWHSFERLSEFRRKNELLKDLAADAGRNETLIERATGWTNPTDADAFHTEGVTLFTTEIHPTGDGYDFAELKNMIAWRDQNS
jgi:hypothetical protein